MKIVAVIQCRLSSTRLPGKAALDMHGMTLLERVIARCRLSKDLDDIIVATSTEASDDLVASLARRADAAVFRGSLDNVHARFVQAAAIVDADAIIRVTADNPFTEPSFIDELISLKRQHPDIPYAVHALDEVVYGTAVELLDVATLSAPLDTLPSLAREHVTTGLSELAQAVRVMPSREIATPALSLTVDRLEEYRVAWLLMQRYGADRDALPCIVADFRRSGCENAEEMIRVLA